jgi:hypothetical protein
MHSLTSVLDGDEWSASRSGRITPRERTPGINKIGGRMGPRADLDKVVKRKISSPCRDSNPRSSQRYITELSRHLSSVVRIIKVKLSPCFN